MAAATFHSPFGPRPYSFELYRQLSQLVFQEGAIWKTALKMAVLCLPIIVAFAVDLCCTSASKMYDFFNPDRVQKIKNEQVENLCDLWAKIGRKSTAIISQHLSEADNMEIFGLDVLPLEPDFMLPLPELHRRPFRQEALQKYFLEYRQANAVELMKRVQSNDIGTIIFSYLGEDVPFALSPSQQITLELLSKITSSKVITTHQWRTFKECKRQCEQQASPCPYLDRNDILGLDMTNSSVTDPEFMELIDYFPNVTRLSSIACSKLSESSLIEVIKKKNGQLLTLALGAERGSASYDAPPTISDQLIQTIVSCLAPKLQSLTLHYCIIATASFQKLVRPLTALRSFSFFHQGYRLKDPELTALANCPLEKFEAVHLTIGHHDGLRAVLTRCPLQDLRLIQSNVDCHDLQGFFQRRNRHLRTFIYERTHWGLETWTFKDAEAQVLSENCSQLQTLVLDPFFLSKEALKNLMTKLLNLECLGFIKKENDQTRQVTQQIDVQEIAKLRPTLKKILLGSTITISDDQIRALIRACPNIQVVGLNETNQERLSSLQNEFPLLTFVRWHSYAQSGLPTAR